MAETPASTRERILDAAQQLFAEHGPEATSLRALTHAAEANLGAVNYHFGSKRELFRAVVRRVLDPVTEQRRRRLEHLGEQPSVEELLDGCVGPFLDLIADQQDRSLARLVGRLSIESDDELRRWILERTVGTDTRYLQAFGQALPHLTDDELRWRFHTVLATIVAQLLTPLEQHAAPADTVAGTTGITAEQARARTLAFLAAGLRTEAT